MGKMKAITLLSSGLDSVAALAIAAKDLNIEMAITFDYGQRARGKLNTHRKYANILGLSIG